MHEISIYCSIFKHNTSMEAQKYQKTAIMSWKINSNHWHVQILVLSSKNVLILTVEIFKPLKNFELTIWWNSLKWSKLMRLMKIETNETNDDYNGGLILMLELSSKIKVMICLFALLYFIAGHSVWDFQGIYKNDWDGCLFVGWSWIWIIYYYLGSCSYILFDYLHGKSEWIKCEVNDLNTHLAENCC